VTAPGFPAGGRRWRRIGLLIAGVVAVAAAAAAAGWSARTIVDSRLPDEQGAQVQTVAVEDGRVARTIDVNVTARWERKVAGFSHCSGVVTSVADPSAPVSVGQAVMSVDLRPVTAAQGTVPLFRDLADGASGADVEQVQALLSELGHRADGSVTGVFEASTTAAVRSWQRAVGLPVTGTVGRCDIVFLETLPARVTFDGVTVGRTIAGDVEVSALSPEPVFEVRTTNDQASLLQPGYGVDIHHVGGAWEAVIGDAHVDSDGQLVVTLVGLDGGSVCGTRCQAVPTTGEALYPGAVHVVPVTEGLVVPTAALMTSPTGDVQVRTDAGALQTVTVLATAGGVSVIDGLEPGTRVQLVGGGRP